MGRAKGEATVLAVPCRLVVVEGATDDVGDLDGAEFDDDGCWTLSRMTLEGEEGGVLAARDVKGAPGEGVSGLDDDTMGCGLALQSGVGISSVMTGREVS